jgi:ferric-dicitrate binding protein FerR (iron transport regulator)
MNSAPSAVRDDTGTAVPDSVLADTNALHHVFLDVRPALLAQARAELGTDAAALAPKVVEQALVAAWSVRGALHSEEQLRHFLTDEIHHSAARTLRRRAAAHRLGSHDTGHAARETALRASPSAPPTPAAKETDVEESWQHLESALHTKTHRAEALEQSAAFTRHEAAGHIAVINRRGLPWWAWVLLALSLVAGALGFARVMDRLSTSAKIDAAVNSPDARTVSSVSAQMGVLTLDDGSKVRLAPDSKLIIPDAFGTLRALRMEGAAGFEVAPDGERELQLYVRNAVLTAKGTSFIVRAYKEDPAAIVVVRAGTVALRQGRGRETRQLAAGDAVVIGDSAAIRTATPDERAAAESWHEGMLSITNVSLGESLTQIKRWYGWDVSAAQPALLSRRVTVRASLDSARQALRGIEASGGVKMTWVDGRMVLRDRLK